jgi:hypothetical protein
MTHSAPLAPRVPPKLMLLLACWLLSLGCSVHPSSRPHSPRHPAPQVCPGGIIEHAVHLARYQLCTEIRGNLTITSPTLRHLRALENVQLIVGDLIIQGNPVLSDLKGLGSLLRVRDVQIIDNLQLPSLNGLNQLQAARTLELRGNQSLKSTLGLARLISLRTLVVRRSQLSTVYALPLVELDALIVADNPRLHSMRGLSQLRKLGYLELRNNPLLFGGRASLLPHLVSTQAFIENGNWSISPAEVERLKDKSRSQPERSSNLLALENR